MSIPAVSFVVLCYNLGHFLEECVGSILRQTYADFEVLIMDDCSPDNTAEIARSFRDPRVRHVRQPVNLGGYRNLNDGLSRARGQFVWLVSADDYLRKDDALARYMAAFAAHPEAGLVFCPSMHVVAGRDVGLGWGNLGDADLTFAPGEFFVRMVHSKNLVSGSSGCVRREFYERFGLWPLDIPHAADCYVLTLISLHYGVVYLADSMVSWRRHELQWTETYENEKAAVKIRSDIDVLWRLKAHAAREGMSWAVATCRQAILDDYVDRVVKFAGSEWKFGLSFPDLQASLESYREDPEQREIKQELVLQLKKALRAEGDKFYRWHDDAWAKRCYGVLLREFGPDWKVYARLGLVGLGRVGRKLYKLRRIAREFMAKRRR